jgi:peptide/nickel transport system permease protein
MLQALLWEFGNWPEIERYYRALLQLYKLAASETSGTSAALKHSYELLNTTDIDEIRQRMAAHETVAAPRLEEAHQDVGRAFERMEAQATPWKNYLPAFRWNGAANQFHQWLFGSENARGGLASGDLGQSYRTQRPVTNQLGEAIGITMQLTLIALLLAFLIAIPLGVFSAAHKDQPLDQGISTTLFLLHSLPAFWIGTLLIIFLGGGDFLHWFPPYGLGNIDGLTFWQALQVRISHLTMPIFCLVYPVLAYLSRQARGGVVNALHQPYITTARAKGLPRRSVVWKHGFRNAMLPVITLLGNMLPFAIGGSVIVEVVFSIPGMGKVSLDALYARDYPVVFGAVLVTAVFTMLGYLLADVFYAMADPRVNFRKRAL